MGALLTAHNIVKRFQGVLAIDRVSFEVKEGSIAALIGPNGAGKTTLFNCFTGFYRPDAGEIRVDGRLLNRLPPYRIAHLGVSRTFQNIRLFGAMTAIENVLVGEHRHGTTGPLGSILRLQPAVKEERKLIERAREVLDFVGLRGKGDSIATSLPYGDQRRLELARALGSRPRILLLDEPTAGMNLQETLAMIALIRRIRDELGTTIVLIEHQMRVVMGVSERITVLDYGEKIAEGSPDDVRRDPRVIEAYLGRGAAEGYAAP